MRFYPLSIIDQNTKLTATLKQGLQAITGNIDTPLNVLNLKGRTLVNLFGRDGNCEDVSKWTDNASTHVLDSTNALYGSNAFKITISGETLGYIVRNLTLDASKYYLFAVAFKNGNASTGIRLQFGGAAGATSYVTSTSYTTAYVKMQPSDAALVTAVWILVNGATGQYAYVDGVRLYEITSTEYNALDTMTANQIAAKYPYVDDVKHLYAPMIEKKGKNLLSPFMEWTLHANTKVIEPYKLQLDSTGASQFSTLIVDVLPNTTYTLSGQTTGEIGVYNVEGTNPIGGMAYSNVFPRTFATGANDKQVKLFFRGLNDGAGSFTFTNLQLELGSTASQFEPQNNDYLYFPDVTLASSLDGNVADSITQRDGTFWKTKRWATDVVLDGSLAWGFSSDGTGTKEVYAPITNNISYDANAKSIKYDGKILKNMGSTSFPGASGTGTDEFNVWNNNRYYARVADTDSGWGESYTPTADEIKVYFNGWRMMEEGAGTPYNGAGTKAWVAIAEAGIGSTTETTVLPTEKATYAGTDFYNLSYQLVVTQEEIVTAEGAIALNAPGNHLAVDSGVIVRERANPYLYGGYYRINNSYGGGSSSYLKNKAKKILAVYKNGEIDSKWTISQDLDPGNYGTASAAIPQVDYDPTAEYTVTYLALDKHTFTSSPDSFTVEYQANDKGVLRQNAQDIADLKRDASINVRYIAELYKRVKSLEG